jgi:hypothetical protein
MDSEEEERTKKPSGKENQLSGVDKAARFMKKEQAQGNVLDELMQAMSPRAAQLKLQVFAESGLIEPAQLYNSTKVAAKPMGGGHLSSLHVNLFYLKDKVLDNFHSLHERYEALSQLKLNRANRNFDKSLDHILRDVFTEKGKQLPLALLLDVCQLIVETGKLYHLKQLLS